MKATCEKGRVKAAGAFVANIAMDSERDKLKPMEGKKNCCVPAYARREAVAENRGKSIFSTFPSTAFTRQDLSLDPILPIFR